MGRIPKVSIGMPVFNGEPFIRKALDSLRAQTFSDFEIVVSDNASTDATSHICQEFANKDHRIKYIRQHVNLGPMGNFQFVLNEARAEYFMWAACDDEWKTQFIEKCLAYLDGDEGVGIVFCKYYVTSRKYPFLRMTRFPDMSFLSASEASERVSGFLLLDEGSHKANAIYGLWRTALAREVLIQMKEYFWLSDLDIQILATVLCSHRICQLPDVQFIKTYKRFPPGSTLDLLTQHVRRLIQVGRRCDISGNANDTAMRIRSSLSLLKDTLVRANMTEDQISLVLSRVRIRISRKLSRLYGLSFAQQTLNSVK